MIVPCRICCAALLICLGVGCSSPKFREEEQDTVQLPSVIVGSNMRLGLSHNDGGRVARELTDPEILSIVAEAGGVTRSELKKHVVERDGAFYFKCRDNDRTSDLISRSIAKYMFARAEGHTKEFTIAALRERAVRFLPADPVLRFLTTNQSLIATSWLKKDDSGTRTNTLIEFADSIDSITAPETDEPRYPIGKPIKVDPADILKWSLYFAVDGEIAWTYSVQCRGDGSFVTLSESRCDAKEYDPKFRDVIAAVEQEAIAEMKKSGDYGQFGSVHGFWSLKKAKLKRRGIEWRSPSELNPNTYFD